MTLRINLWSGPRNVSTALMYSFRSRADTTVVDEPLYGHYLATSGVAHPGDDEVMATMDTDGNRVVREVILADYPTPVVFFKQMAHHLVGDLDAALLDACTNALLTRSPVDMLPSLGANLETPTLHGTSYPMQIELLDRLTAAGRPPVVIDARLLLDDPHGVLSAVCQRIGVAWDPAMLSWPAGPKPEDGIWAKHWYQAVHGSTGFGPPRHKRDPFPDRLRGLLAETEPLYERLAAVAVRGAETQDS